MQVILFIAIGFAIAVAILRGPDAMRRWRLRRHVEKIKSKL